ncbi:M56 family metallopeptidase [Mucilaginibacter rigui]|uniref:M56 family metallopeptidase n=1 Tax=Mucilaginibacter rigui TaxID=534635 RepID=A0ABR7X1P3_9SPHI|nr:M56 family metallopeptidase [Mucilaginibacter rigui]MBD1384518.1 M56 family metallopeptidase [Mucilaginibacter rigui]
MPALFVFLFKVNIALLLFCAGYYLVLRHLTFYTLNRAYLMVAIVFATLYPKIDLSDFAQRHETLAKPVQTVVLNWQAPAVSLIKPLTQPNYWQWATVIFWAGAIFLGFRLLMQLFSLFQLYRQSKPARIHEHDVRIMEGEAAPFSFWRSIYVNPANHTPTDLQAILLHEQVHVNGWHTIDILLAELSSVFYWFNPGIWLMKKAVRENIEFITDRKILNKGFDSKTYQYSLVNVSFNATTPGIVNHFNISTIKKRIIMMNAKRSSKFKLARYAFVVPAVVVLLLVFTLSKAEITKPITRKIALTIKPVTTAIKQAAQTAIAFADTVPDKKAKTTTAKTAKTDTLKLKKTLFVAYDVKADTGKKQKIYIRTANNHTIDSMNIVLNGKKVDNAIFSKVDPSTIESVNIINSGDRKFNAVENYTFNNNKDVIFIATKDSEEGKALSDKLGKRRQITNIRINGVNKNTDNLSGSEVAVISALPGLKLNGNVNNVTVIARKKDGSTSADDVKEVVVTGYGTATKLTDSIHLNGNNIVFAATPQTKLKNVKGWNTTASYVYTTNSTNVNRISDKLIVIDGKIASEKELKKLSAFDIDRMSTSNSADTVKKYGDKAKYGVVYIYTKKGKQ